MSDRRVIALGIILVIVLGMGVYVSFSGTPQVPPPSYPPGEIRNIIVSHDLAIWAEAMYWQDFMPSFGSEGPPFSILIWVNVTNIGNTTVSNFEAVRTTIYFHNNSYSIPLVTFNLIIVGDPTQIGPGESFILEFTNDRESIFSPTIEEGAVLYSRILTRWGYGIEVILTTPPSALGYTH